MAFNDYITLDSYKYSTLQTAWVPRLIIPNTGRMTLQGNFDVTFGPHELYQWEGAIKAKVSPASGYGSPSNFETSAKKLTKLTFIDHYEVTYSVVIQKVEKSSLQPDWAGASNEIYYTVVITGTHT